jgi:hypothetical protein
MFMRATLQRFRHLHIVENLYGPKRRRHAPPAASPLEINGGVLVAAAFATPGVTTAGGSP